ncbi:MAG: formylglycine-generating enzyme family protein [Kofleriaceae bacterium]
MKPGRIFEHQATAWRAGCAFGAMITLLAMSQALAGSASTGRLAAGRVVRIEKVMAREVIVPAGSFAMGVDDNIAGYARDQCLLAFPSQRVQTIAGRVVDFCGDYFTDLTRTLVRSVYVDAFAIDRDEVTVADYRACVAAGGCALDPLVGGDERYVRGEWPMVNATWEEAREFCGWRGGRLPSEAEWERAARGDGATAWPWGELEQPNDFNHGQPRSQTLREIERPQPPPPIRYFGDPDASDRTAILAPPGSYPWGEGPYGTRDQAGNVAEWTADAFIPRRGYDDLPAVNPLRDAPGAHARVVRGGSWRQPAFVARSNLRDPFNEVYRQDQRFSHIGFRCARSVR